MLVGHSYGGLVIGGVTEKVPERIRRLVYLDAYIPQDNKSAFDIIPGLETIYKERALKEQGRDWLVASYKPEEFGMTNPDDIYWMNSRLSPMPWHTHDQPLGRPELLPTINSIKGTISDLSPCMLELRLLALYFLVKCCKQTVQT